MENTNEGAAWMRVPITADELAALRRFKECADDGEGYDVPKEMMRRLAEIGLLNRKSGNYFQPTDFGMAVLEGGAPHSDPLAAANAGDLSATVSYSLLPDMTYSLDGVPVGSPGWHARSGWNSAVIHLGDRLRPAAAGAAVVGWQNRMAPDQIVEGKNPPDRSDKWVPLVYAADRAPAQGAAALRAASTDSDKGSAA